MLVRLRRCQLQVKPARCKPHRKYLQRRQQLEELEEADVATEVAEARKEVVGREVQEGSVVHKAF